MADTTEPTENGNPELSRRRSSFAGQTFAELFGVGRNKPAASPDNTQSNPTGSYPGPITSAAAQAQRRRVSLNPVATSSSPNQNSSFGSFGARRGSIASSNSASIDENAVEDETTTTPSQPQTPFARRMSFGARALRDVKTNSGGGSPNTNGRASIADTGVSPASGPESGKKTRVDAPTTAKGRDGFNWADNFRNRAERSSSINSTSGMSPNLNHVRAKSIATMEPPPAEQPKPQVPDHFQERILKGDFYMD